VLWILSLGLFFVCEKLSWLRGVFVNIAATFSWDRAPPRNVWNLFLVVHSPILHSCWVDLLCLLSQRFLQLRTLTYMVVKFFNLLPRCDCWPVPLIPLIIHQYQLLLLEYSPIALINIFRIRLARFVGVQSRLVAWASVYLALFSESWLLLWDEFCICFMRWSLNSNLLIFFLLNSLLFHFL
jgi:hypothetical protein